MFHLDAPIHVGAAIVSIASAVAAARIARRRLAPLPAVPIKSYDPVRLPWLQLNKDRL